jgi:hypothetical protein
VLWPAAGEVASNPRRVRRSVFTVVFRWVARKGVGESHVGALRHRPRRVRAAKYRRRRFERKPRATGHAVLPGLSPAT